MPGFDNTASLSAIQGGEPLTESSTVQVALDGVFFSKSADKDIWNNGPLTYTITLINDSLTDIIEQAVIVDNIDLNYTSFVEGSVTFTPDNAGTFEYEPDGKLTFTLDDVNVGQSVVISFRVNRAV